MASLTKTQAFRLVPRANTDSYQAEKGKFLLLYEN